MFINYDKQFTKLEVWRNNIKVHNLKLDKNQQYKEICFFNHSNLVVSSKLNNKTLKVNVLSYKYLDIDFQHSYTIYFTIN